MTLSLSTYSTLGLPQLQHPHVNINTYADDLSIISQHHQIRTATIYLQEYINTLEEWLQNNRISASAQKPSITLFTPYRKESNKHPRISLGNNPLPLNKTLTLLGVIYNIFVALAVITAKATKILNTLKTLCHQSTHTNKRNLSNY